MTANLRAAIKLILFVFTVCCYFLTSFIFYPFTWVAPFMARKILIRLISFYSLIGLRFMGVSVSGEGQLEAIKSSFIVSNHMGYLDVLVMASKLRACFVTSLEMRQTPFLGQLCEMGGCLYVDRRSKSNLAQEVKMLTEALQSGLNVCVFPEGTSTDGSEVLRFRRPLFKAAVDVSAAVNVMCLNYVTVDGQKVNDINRDKIFWYGDMTFFPHLWNFLKLKKVVVTLSHLGQILEVKDHVEISLIAHKMVSSNFRAILTSCPKEEWRESLDFQVQNGAQF